MGGCPVAEDGRRSQVVGEGDPGAVNAHRWDLTAGEERRHLVFVGGRHRTREVDAAVDLGQAACLEANRDLLPSHAGREHLGASDYPKLQARDARDHPICEMGAGLRRA